MSKSIQAKLEILADAAKYDASCASSGAPKRDSKGKAGIGSTTGAGICHSYTPDGRCVSLLKILLTNSCIFDCSYCINRRSSNVRRARFTVEEVVKLTLEFYKRNYIEGLFLSSGIIASADYTMEQLVEVARQLREVHHFRGYIHLKAIPEASQELAAQAGRYADRLSINIELPTENGLKAFAPEKRTTTIRSTMAGLKLRIDESKDARKTLFKAPKFSPSGQSTQMIVGADSANDATILTTSANLYAGYGLRRIYYSAFSPIPDSSSALPLSAAPLQREHRLYQADWLMRYYGFAADEITAGASSTGMLDLAIDPKLAWALRNREKFPVDINTADREVLLRVPGLGARTVDRLIAARRHRTLRLDDLTRLTSAVRRARPFIITPDHRPVQDIDSATLHARFAPKPVQMNLFG
ncbi:MAG: putative DNA modification/repair radical SAM protein [Pseudolabrys sp.]|nr:putative DNA modification/repair radical SAM protein [Pseudolabrys sp.]